MEDNWHDARVDPFEPSRVWITTRPSVKVVGPLECFGVKVRRHFCVIYPLVICYPRSELRKGRELEK